MRNDKKLLFSLIVILLSGLSSIVAQPRGGFNRNDMILREKQNLYDEVATLSEDQKILIDGIYDEFSQSLGEVMEEVRKTRDWQSMRPKMEELRTEKDGLMFDVLNEDQFEVYTKLSEDQRNRRENRREGGSPPIN